MYVFAVSLDFDILENSFRIQNEQKPDLQFSLELNVHIFIAIVLP